MTPSARDWFGIRRDEEGCYTVCAGNRVSTERTIVRVSHFPNITRAHALAFEVRRDLTAELREQSWRRLHFVSDISGEPFDRFLSDAQEVGFLRGSVDLSV
jgi:hypothetical protein